MEGDFKNLEVSKANNRARKMGVERKPVDEEVQEKMSRKVWAAKQGSICSCLPPQAHTTSFLLRHLPKVNHTYLST
jgi:hypothetical protein